METLKYNTLVHELLRIHDRIAKSKCVRPLELYPRHNRRKPVISKVDPCGMYTLKAPLIGTRKEQQDL